jgi:hypothetical protein
MQNMLILCEVNQAECFRRGIDAPKSTIKIEVNPAKLPEELRAFVADNLSEGYRLSMRDEFYLRRPDLIGFMEAILVAKDFSEAPKDKDPFFSKSFSDRMKEVDAVAKDKWEMRAKELAEAQSDDVLIDDVRKQKIAQAALSKSDESKGDKETREEQHEKRINEQYEKRMNEQEKLGPEKPLGSKK